MTRSQRTEQRKKKKSSRGILRGIALCITGIVLVTAGVLAYNGIIHPEGPVPGQPEGLEAEVCYHDIALHWQPAQKADGYRIYAAKTNMEEPDYELVGEVEGGENCAFELTEYIHDQKYVLRVAAYGENFLTKNRTEGEMSAEVTARYDSSKYAQKIPVLTYHDLVPTGYAIVNGLTVPENVFEEQMDYLKDNGYRTLSLDEFYQWYQGKLEVPVKSCVVTFDDGAYEVYYLAYPILKRNDQSATIFCIGHHLEETGDNTAPYTPEDGIARRFGTDVLEELRTDYPKLACESHTYNMHKRINGYKPVNRFTYDEMMEDFQKNDQFGFRYLAYPWGATNKKMKKAAASSGYRLAFGYGPFRYARRSDDPYRVSRIKVSAYYSMDWFRQMMEGAMEEEPAE